MSTAINTIYFIHSDDWLEKMGNDLIEWPCQDFHGGRDAGIRADAMCKHPECHPRNDDRNRRIVNDHPSQ